MRGEYPPPLRKQRPSGGSPPHARGIRVQEYVIHPMLGITPACAGNTNSSCVHSDTSRDHPRMRGEYLLWVAMLTLIRGSPPHARGILPQSARQKVFAGITPACAGNTSLLLWRLGNAQDHPRMRGEYTPDTPLRFRKKGSPPHARGILETR